MDREGWDQRYAGRARRAVSGLLARRAPPSVAATAYPCGETEAPVCTFYARDRGQTTLARRRSVGHSESMADRSYHDYATSALRELELDLASSQGELQDERADYARRADADIDDLRRLDGLIGDLGQQLAAIDRELLARRREPVGRRI